MKTAHLYTDGAARGNPGPAGAGVVLSDGKGKVIFEWSKYLGEATNNQAEYTALSEGLRKALDFGFSRVYISLDSELVVKQVKGEYKIKNEGLKPHFKNVMKLLEQFKSYTIRHIPREENKEADRLANKAIDEVL